MDSSLPGDGQQRTGPGVVGMPGNLEGEPQEESDVSGRAAQ